MCLSGLEPPEHPPSQVDEDQDTDGLARMLDDLDLLCSSDDDGSTDESLDEPVMPHVVSTRRASPTSQPDAHAAHPAPPPQPPILPPAPQQPPPGSPALLPRSPRPPRIAVPPTGVASPPPAPHLRHAFRQISAQLHARRHLASIAPTPVSPPQVPQAPEADQSGAAPPGLTRLRRRAGSQLRPNARARARAAHIAKREAAT